ncbi:MAG TPA: hypothetical protein VJB65_01565 [Patescibacteria group bacterium]|nr:hypothetical protein [Patescibacteria group bacterium]
MTTKQLAKQLTRVESEVDNIRRKLEKLHRKEKKEQQIQQWKKVGGILSKKKINAVTWQRKMRSEWDHRSN